MTKRGTVFSQAVGWLEDAPVPFGYFIFSFFCVIQLRNFLELFCDQPAVIPLRMLHYTLFYALAAAGVALCLRAATGVQFVRILRVVMAAFIVVLLGPLIDLVLSFGRGFNIGYLQIADKADLLQRFFSFFGSYRGSGVTPGIRIELGAVLLSVFGYCLLKTNKLIRSVFCGLFVYVWFFALACMPLWARLSMRSLGLAYVYSDSVMLGCALLGMLILLPLCLWAWEPGFARALIRDMRPERILHYLGMWALGIAYGCGDFVWQQQTVFAVFFIPAAIFFACIFCLVTNNIVDQPIDAVSNASRPLVSGAIPRDIYRRIGWAALFLALLYSAAAGAVAFACIALFIAAYSLYSLPPVRFKRVPIFSKLPIALNCLALFVLGQSFGLREVRLPPSQIRVYFLVWFALAAQVIDLKDYEGDRQAGILTLPVLLGLKRSKMLIAAFVFAAYLCMLPLLPDLALGIPLVIAAGVSFFLVNRPVYDERPVFAVYLISLASIIVYLFWCGYRVCLVQ